MPDCYLRVASDADVVEKGPDEVLRHIRECANDCGHGHVKRDHKGNQFVEAWVEYRTQELCEQWRPELEKCLAGKGDQVVESRCE